MRSKIIGTLYRERFLKQMNRFRWLAFCIFLSYIAFISLLWPIFYTFFITFRESSAAFPMSWISYLMTPLNLQAFWNSLQLGAASVVCCGIAGSFLAFYTGLYRPKGSSWLHTLLFLPFVLPGIISVIGFIQIYAPSGFFNQLLKKWLGLQHAPFGFSGLGAILLIHTGTQYVIFYLQMRLAFIRIDLSLVEAARQLGARPWQVFTDVFWPSLKTPVLGCSLLTFISAISSFSAPYLVGGRFQVMSSRILLSKINQDLPMARAQMLLLFMLCLGLMLVYQKKAPAPVAVSAQLLKNSERWQIDSPFWRFLVHVGAIFLTALIFLPLVFTFIFSFAQSSQWMTQLLPSSYNFDNYRALLSNPRALSPLKNTLLMSLQACVFVLGICVLLLWPQARKSRRFERISQMLCLLPSGIPASSLGIFLISAFNHPWWFTGGVKWTGSVYLLPLAYAISSLPLGYRIIHSAAQNFPEDLAYAAASLRASARSIFWKIRLPLIFPSLMSAFLYCFMRSAGEYNLSALLYTLRNRPISIGMVSAMHDYDMGLCFAYASVVMAVCLLAGSIGVYFEKKVERK